MHSAECNLYFLFCLCLVSALVCALLFVYSGAEEGSLRFESSIECDPGKDKKTEKLSLLGKWLLVPEGAKPPKVQSQQKDQYLILVWNYGPFLERRHIRRFTAEQYSPWENCSMSNCVLTYKPGDLERADAVLFHLHLTKGIQELPVRKNLDQIWIFLTDESPWNSFVYQRQNLSDYNGLFNWSMTYRLDSDVPVPYGRTVPRAFAPFPLRTADNTVLLKKSKLAVVLISNCASHNNRWNLIQELKSHLAEDLDILGGCSELYSTCPGHFNKDCQTLESYKFYLAFENSNCREYLTEKVFWNSYHKWAVPVIYGPRKQDCDWLLPSGSFLHVKDFASAKELAQHLLFLGANQEKYLKLHSWRNCFAVLNEHGYFGSQSQHYCRLCEALNYNPRVRKIYDDLEAFWSIRRDCER